MHVGSNKGSNPFVVVRGGLIFILSPHSIGSCLKNTLYVKFSWFFKNFKICRHFVQPIVLVPTRFVKSYDVGLGTCVYVQLSSHLHTYIHTYIHTSIHPSIHYIHYIHYIHVGLKARSFWGREKINTNLSPIPGNHHTFTRFKLHSLSDSLVLRFHILFHSLSNWQSITHWMFTGLTSHSFLIYLIYALLNLRSCTIKYGMYGMPYSVYGHTNFVNSRAHKETGTDGPMVQTPQSEW